VSGSLGVAYVPPQSATRDEDHRRHGNGYLFVETAYGIPKTPFSLSAGLGYERGAFDEVENRGKWDWKVGAEAQLAAAKLGLAYIGSNADDGDHGVVASLLLSW
jgi:predicted porin